MKTIFLSDIHIGTDSVTNLYRTATDQINLKRILSYIQKNSSQVKDLVILGDWVDLWMYPASVVPPTVEQIMEANPQIFTCQSDGSGDFVSCLDSIQGTIHYVSGNHDITVTSDEINNYFKLSSKTGKQVLCSPKKYISGVGRIYGEHGHWYSMVCKPYKNESLPLGYYITRAGMQIMVSTQKSTKIPRLILKAQKSLPSIDVIGIQELISYNGLTFSQAMLTNQANQMGLALEDMIFTMSDSSTINAKEVADKFPDLSINDVEFLRTDVGGSLDESAKKLSAEHKFVIFGHTHIKQMNSRYANIGFLCANEPNQNGIPVSSFVEIEDTNGHGPYSASLINLNYETGVFSTDKTVSFL
jgi:predicted phosphodiesterase